ncbi:MAG: hypothetical protein WA294_15370 [Acidobacteriaceae bacterium]
MLSRNLLAVCTLSAFVCVLSSGPALAQSPNAQQAAPPTPQNQTASPAQSQPQLQDLPPDSHTLSPAEEAKEREQQTLAAALRLASLQAHWGAEMSTPGLSMSLVETGRAKTADGATQISYHITASGFTPGDSLSLIRWPLNEQAQKVISGLALTADGTLICAAPQANPTPTAPSTAPSGPTAPSCTTTMKPSDPVLIQATVAQGEAIRVAVVDDDRSRGAAASVVPFPLAGQDQGCKLSIIIGLKDASMVLVEGTGFPPNTPLKLESITGSNTRQLSPRTNADGRLVVVDLPESKGAASGTTTVRFSGVTHFPTLEDSRNPAQPDPTCSPSVTYPWGKGAYKLQ